MELPSGRATDKHPTDAAVIDDLLSAYDNLDFVNSVPVIYCEAVDLLGYLPFHLLTVLQDTCSLVDKLHANFTDLSSCLSTFSIGFETTI